MHIDHCQAMRSKNYIEEIIESEIANGIPSEKIFIASFHGSGGYLA
jgi:hypothetical protein